MYLSLSQLIVLSLLTDLKDFKNDLENDQSPKTRETQLLRLLEKKRKEKQLQLKLYFQKLLFY